jgi:hypothetical protein
MSSTTELIQLGASLSQIALVLGLYLAWRQLKVAINDIKLRSRREAGLLAIKEAEVFANDLLPYYSRTEKKAGGYTAPKDALWNFVPSEISPVNMQKYRDAVNKIHADVDLYADIATVANKIDSVAICFIKRIADEEVVFETIGPIFCEMIDDLYFFYCHIRRTKPEDKDRILPYNNTLELYRLWRKRMESFQLEVGRKELAERTKLNEEQLTRARAISAPIEPLGTE